MQKVIHSKVPDNRKGLGNILAGEKLEEALKLGVVLARPFLERILAQVLLEDGPLGKVLAKVLDGALGNAAKGLEVVLEVGTTFLELVAKLFRDLERRDALHRLENEFVLDGLLHSRRARLVVERKTNLNALRVHHFLQDVRKSVRTLLNLHISSKLGLKLFFPSISQNNIIFYHEV